MNNFLVIYPIHMLGKTFQIHKFLDMILNQQLGQVDFKDNNTLCSAIKDSFHLVSLYYWVVYLHLSQVFVTGSILLNIVHHHPETLKGMSIWCDMWWFEITWLDADDIISLQAIHNIQFSYVYLNEKLWQYYKYAF